MKILVLSSLAYSLVNFRGRLMQALVGEGHDVVACAPDADENIYSKLAEMGIKLYQTPMNRAGMNPFQDLRTLFSYWQMMRRERPDIIIAYTQKPIIYGGLAARFYNMMSGKARYYVLMSGLGYVYSPEADRRPMLRKITSILYRAAVKNARAIFTFNADDRHMMMDNKIIGHEHHIVQVPGSGIDIDYFTHHPLPDGPPVFLMIARMMRDKGVREFADAARLVKQQYPDAVFRLLGKLEPENPTGISPEECQKWSDEGILEIYPETRDVRPYLAAAHIFVLPSYYREGLPRTLLEALATGRALLTTDMPGCREPVQPGKNGWLVPPRDAATLAEHMMKMIRDPDLTGEMGRNSRALAVSRYDVEKVNEMLLQCMGLIRASSHHSSAPANVRATGILAARVEF